METAIILGGGISGLVSAIKLKKLGYRIILIEKRKLCTHEGGGIDIHPNGTRILFSLDPIIEKKIRNYHQNNLKEIKIGNAEGTTLNTVPLSMFEKNPRFPLTSFFRQDLLSILKESANIDELYEESMYTNISIDSKGIEIEVDRLNTPLKGDLLIGADGVNSKMRKFINPRTEKRYLGHISLGGCVPRKYYHHNYIHGLNRTCVVLPCTEDACHTVMFLPKPEGYLQNGILGFEEKKKLFLGWSDEVDAILQNLKDEHRFAVESYEVPALDFYAKGAVFLVGDSAHAMSPLGALATTLALEDIEDLEICLKSKGSINERAALYHEKRKTRTDEFREFSLQFLVPTITKHQLSDYQKRMEKIAQTPPEQIFKSLIHLTQSKIEEDQYALN